MIFLSYLFVGFAVLFFPAYWLIRQVEFRRTLLIAACFVFHWMFAGPAGVAPIVVVGIAVFFAGRSQKKWACWAGIALSALALIGYKYTQFLIASGLSHVLPAETAAAWAVGAKGLLPDAPPLAISFFTFEFVHYLVEVLHGKPAIRRLREFTLFCLYWPSLVAGPIKRYDQFLPALEEGLRSVAGRDIAIGMMRVAIGGVKKIAADNLTAAITFYSPQFESIGCSERWLVLLAISLRILLDFSGYSDMAIGFARMMGITLPENFRWPYLARSISDFWRRWHISLSSWIRDYVYIPLGGSRCGIVRRVANGLLAFAICGLWHGPSLNFLVWGLYHGLGLALHTAWVSWKERHLPALNPLLARLPIDPGWIVTMLFVAFGWLLFFYPLDRAWTMFTLLFRPT